jgi:NAD(P)-dependent dehydrogenase (short-subunit alcohol dehydrogenase family)
MKAIAALFAATMISATAADLSSIPFKDIKGKETSLKDFKGKVVLIVNTASIAAFEGQFGQCAYAASKAGVVGLALPAARELARSGIRVMTIAPGLMETPMLAGLPDPAREALLKLPLFPRRLGAGEDFARLVLSIAANPMLNGEVIRLDGGLRLPPQ